MPPLLLLLKDVGGGHSQSPRGSPSSSPCGLHGRESTGVCPCDVSHVTKGLHAIIWAGSFSPGSNVSAWSGKRPPSVSLCWGLGWDGPAQGRQSDGKSQQGYPLSTTALISCWGWGRLHDRTEQKINKNTPFGQGQPIYCGILGEKTDELVL